MNGRRKLVLLALAVSPVLVIGAACSFPDVSFAPAGARSEGGAGDGGMGEGAVVGANEDVDPDGASQEAATRPDGGGKADAAGCTCDCDHDGFTAMGNVCEGGTSAMLDCDDLDALIKPDSGFVAADWSSTHTPSGDWNCDGMRTKQYDYNQKCNDPNNCNGKSGFNDDPNCEETTDYNNCAYSPPGLLNLPPASCTIGSTVKVTQHCK